jgi:hypothetical protein
MTQNEGQKYLWKWWMWHIKTWPKLDLLYLNGDLIDGPQRKSQATGLLTADLGEQAEIAKLCLAPLIAKADKVVRLSGTPYHETFGGALGAVDEYCEANTRGYAVGVEHSLELPSGGLHIGHHPGSGGSIYKGTIVDREILWSIIAASLEKAPDTNIIIRSHVHYYQMMQTHGKTFILTPCWELQSRHAKSRNRYRWCPDIGSVLLTENKNAYSGYDVHVKRVPLPKSEVAKVSFSSI